MLVASVDKLLKEKFYLDVLVQNIAVFSMELFKVNLPADSTWSGLLS
jgi:hypothetical protein